MQNKKILITVPNTKWIHKSVVHILLKLQMDGRYSITTKLPSARPYENNLNQIVRDFLDGEYDFWLSIDVDNAPLRNPLDLIELDKDIIGLPTPIWHFENKKKGERPIYWNGYDYSPEDLAYKEHLPREGLQRVDAIGTGCFLIARRVFLNPEMQQGSFVRKLNMDGSVEKGNDISFCERARDQGFEIYCHYDYPCHHIMELDLHEAAYAIKELING
jgi:hypothetical protein